MTLHSSVCLEQPNSPSYTLYLNVGDSITEYPKGCQEVGYSFRNMLTQVWKMLSFYHKNSPIHCYDDKNSESPREDSICSLIRLTGFHTPSWEKFVGFHYERAEKLLEGFWQCNGMVSFTL